MSNASQFFGGQRRVASITNQWSTNGSAPTQFAGAGQVLLGTKLLTANTPTANALVSILSITGSGSLNLIGVKTANATSRTARLVVTIDGRVIFDSTSSAIAQVDAGICAVGSTGTANSPMVMQPIPFINSALVQVASSLAESGGLIAFVNYEVNA